MNNKYDGGPAFASACEGPGGRMNIQRGMSLRDYFAGQVLAGLCSAHDADGGWTGADVGSAMEAYRIADAMIEERQK